MKRHLRISGVVVALLVLTQALAVEFTSTSASAPSTMIQSNDALAYLELDFENRPGWILGLKGGYQWMFYKDHGTRVDDSARNIHYKTTDDTTKGGMAASASIGYNFGPRVPLTVGLNIGFGAGGNLNTHGLFTSNGQDYMLNSRQKVRVLTLDLGIDYDFKNCSRWTPFVGLTGGVAFISDRGKASMANLTTGELFEGKYGKKHRTNLVGGFRLGTKYNVNDCIELSLYGSYTYLGSIKGHNYNLYGANGTVSAHNEKIKAHAVDVKAGIKISF